MAHGRAVCNVRLSITLERHRSLHSAQGSICIHHPWSPMPTAKLNTHPLQLAEESLHGTVSHRPLHLTSSSMTRPHGEAFTWLGPRVILEGDPDQPGGDDGEAVVHVGHVASTSPRIPDTMVKHRQRGHNPGDASCKRTQSQVSDT